MPDYSKCVIYKLCCKNLDVKDIYVGSTCNFTRRKNRHKTDSSNLNSKVYKFIRDNGGFQNWDMVMVEEYPCENKMQKVKRERHWYEELKATLNTNHPSSSKKETGERYYKNNKEKIKEYKKNNSEKVKEYKKEYREKNKEKIKQYQKEYQKNNFDKNKEYYREYMRKYREANKDAINQKRREYYAKKKIELLKAKE